MQALSQELADNFKPKTTGYFEIWLSDDEGEKTNVADFQPVEEPIYGETYLPRKFKMAVAEPADNCVDVYTQDLGLLAVIERDNRLLLEKMGHIMRVGGSVEHTNDYVSNRWAFRC